MSNAKRAHCGEHKKSQITAPKILMAENIALNMWTRFDKCESKCRDTKLNKYNDNKSTNNLEKKKNRRLEQKLQHTKQDEEKEEEKKIYEWTHTRIWHI